MAKTHLQLVAPTTVKQTVGPWRRPNSDYRTREHMTEAEIEKLIAATKDNRYGHRDATMILVAYRHGSSAACAVPVARNSWLYRFGPVETLLIVGTRNSR